MPISWGSGEGWGAGCCVVLEQAKEVEPSGASIRPGHISPELLSSPCPPWPPACCDSKTLSPGLPPPAASKLCGRPPAHRALFPENYPFHTHRFFLAQM